jgi:hypothetical protein
MVENTAILSRTFREADPDWICMITGIGRTLNPWNLFESELDASVIPPQGFKEGFEKVTKAFQMTNEAGRRVILNLFLCEIILLPEFRNALRIFPELDMSVESHGSNGGRLRGKTDYTVGFSNGANILENKLYRELHLVAIEAKNHMDHKDLWQCVAETAALHKCRNVLSGEFYQMAWAGYS